jgi:hypothetical protein
MPVSNNTPKSPKYSRNDLRYVEPESDVVNNNVIVVDGLNVTTVSLTDNNEKISHRSAQPPESPALR